MRWGVEVNLTRMLVWNGFLCLGQRYQGIRKGELEVYSCFQSDG